jgi:hypothetical protein
MSFQLQQGTKPILPPKASTPQSTLSTSRALGKKFQIEPITYDNNDCSGALWARSYKMDNGQDVNE